MKNESLINAKDKTLKKPIISVIMAVYNDEKYLREAVESILNQTYGNFEFIIFDDASTDNSANILKKFAMQDKRVRLIINEKNKGLTKNLNVGLRLAKGDYIARMDGDDISLTERFEKQLKYFSNHKDIVMCGTWTYSIDENGKTKSISKYPTGEREFFWSSVFRPSVAHPSVMIKREILSSHGLSYNENYRTAQDYDLWSRLQEFGAAGVLTSPELKYRSHTNNVSTLRKNEQRKNASDICLTNIKRHFFDFYETHGTAQIKQLTDFLFLSEKMNKNQLSKSIKLILLLQNTYISKAKPTTKEKSSIKKLTIRWIIQGILNKQETNFSTKLYATILLTPYFVPIILELKDFFFRRIEK